LPSRISVRDCHLTPESREKLGRIDTGLQFTEWKFENALDRVTAASNPRQLERVPAGAEFKFEITYNVETQNNDEVKEDLDNILDTLSILEDDYLGGHGSRGYGRVKFEIETFTGKKISYYSAITTEEKKERSASPELQDKNVSECKSSIGEVLSVFE